MPSFIVCRLQTPPTEPAPLAAPEACTDRWTSIARLTGLALALALWPAMAGAQVNFLPNSIDTYFRSGSGVDVAFTGQPGCTVQPCNEFDVAFSEADLSTLTPALPASVGDSVMNVGLPGIATGSASSSGSITIELDLGQLTGGTFDLAGSLNGSISRSYLEGESLVLQGTSYVPVAFSFVATGPAWIHLFGSISKSNPDPSLFDDDSFVQLRLTPGNVYADIDQVGGFDLGWVPLVVGQPALIFADVQLQLSANNEDCECTGTQLMMTTNVHFEFEIVPEPGSAVSQLAAILVLGILSARRARGSSRSESRARRRSPRP